MNKQRSYTDDLLQSMPQSLSQLNTIFSKHSPFTLLKILPSHPSLLIPSHHPLQIPSHPPLLILLVPPSSLHHPSPLYFLPPQSSTSPNPSTPNASEPQYLSHNSRSLRVSRPNHPPTCSKDRQRP
uniref:Uncharacterized protein n=1 Tax=Cacopsylla melanoneura TaxID=428564 RepID=A0A8D8X8K5_9HEMI